MSIIAKSTFEIQGRIILLPHITSVYPVEGSIMDFELSFDLDGEKQHYYIREKEDAEKMRLELLDAINAYWMSK